MKKIDKKNLFSIINITLEVNDLDNLYFKTSLFNSYSCGLVYARFDDFMLTRDINGKLIKEKYVEKEFIPVIDFFNKADRIYKYASRVKPARIMNFEEITFFDESGKAKDFILLYATENMGIGYYPDLNIYVIIPKLHICDYKTGGWRFENETLSLQIKEADIVNGLLNKEKGSKGIDENQLKLVKKIFNN